MLTEEKLNEVFKGHFPEGDFICHLEGDRLQLRLIDGYFSEMKLFDRQKKVNAILSEYIQSKQIHSVQMKVYASFEEYEAKSS